MPSTKDPRSQPIRLDKLLQRPISVFHRSYSRNPEAAAPILSDVFESITGKEYQRSIDRAKSLIDPENPKTSWQEAKAKCLAAWTFGYTYEPTDTRSKKAAIEDKRYTNLLVLDWDLGAKGQLKNKTERIALKKALAKDPYILGAWKSPGNGLKALVAVEATSVITFKSVFQAASAYFRKRYGKAPDPSGKDPSRLCFVCSDPNAYIADPSKKKFIHAFKPNPGTMTDGRIIEATSEDAGFSTWNRKASQEDLDRLVARLKSCEVTNGSRHNVLLRWVVDARAIGLSLEQVKEVGEEWMEEQGRSLQENEIENAWAGAIDALKSGDMKPSPGIRPDIDFGVPQKYDGDGVSEVAILREQAEAQGASDEDIAEIDAREIDVSWMNDLIQNDQGMYVNKATNVLLFALNHPKFLKNYKYDTFLETMYRNNKELKESSLAVLSDLEDAAGRETFVAHKADGDLIMRAMIDSEKISYDSLTNYVKSLKWDGVPRLTKWLTTYAKALPTPYVETVGRKFLIGAIARAIEPGCKMDTMLILEGPQGCLKSTAVQVLFGREYVNASMRHGTDEDLMCLRGIWCVEWAELQGSFRHVARREEIKAFITTETDTYRAKYAKQAVARPRRFVMVGTTNQGVNSRYLNDESGLRRFWPVAVAKLEKKIDIKALKNDREQLLAEAYAAYLDGEPWHLSKSEERLRVQETQTRQELSSFHEPLEEYISANPARKVITATEARLVLGIDSKDRRNSWLGRQLAFAFKSHGWERRRIYDSSGKEQWAYVKLKKLHRLLK